MVLAAPGSGGGPGRYPSQLPVAVSVSKLCGDAAAPAPSPQPQPLLTTMAPSRPLTARLRQALPLGAAFAAGAVFSAGIASADQPNMQNALSQLYGAQASLRAAAPNKGGHRDAALNLVARAIEQVQLGIAYAAGR